MGSNELILAAFFLDLLLGDPRGIPHPVRGMGRLIASLEKKLNKGKNETILKIKGAFTAITVILVASFSTFALLRLARYLSPSFESILVVILSFFCLSTRDLYDHGMRIAKALEDKDMARARRFLSLIVSRDTCGMDENEIVRSSIESISENTNDGICAPLFYLLLGGPVLSMAYKASSTLDSMLGYRNERYLHFGWFSARLDDLLNFVPARISAFLIAVSALLYCRSPYTFLRSFRTFLCEGRNHPSPNSGLPEAAMAGALGIRISGPHLYGGRLVIKPFIGEDRADASPTRIKEALHVAVLTSFIMLFGGLILRGL